MSHLKTERESISFMQYGRDFWPPYNLLLRIGLQGCVVEIMRCKYVSYFVRVTRYAPKTNMASPNLNWDSFHSGKSEQSDNNPR